MAFVLPTYSSEALWGPIIDDRESLRVYSKGERMNRIADFPSLTDEQKKAIDDRKQSGFHEVKNEGEVKELKRAKKTTQGRGRGAGGAPYVPARGRGAAWGGGRGAAGGRGRGFAPKEQVICLPTLKITDDLMVKPFDYANFAKYPEVDILAMPDVKVTGKCRQYAGETFERASGMRPIRLAPVDAPRIIPDPVLKDPVMRDFVMSLPAERSCIFASDVALAKLMTCTSAVNAFDIQIVTNGKVTAIVDRPAEMPEDPVTKQKPIDVLTEDRLYYEWVNETASVNAPSEDQTNTPSMNSSVSLAKENAKATQSFIEAVTSKSVVGWPDGERCDLEKKPKAILRYRRWTLNKNMDDEVDVVIRCELDTVVKTASKHDAFTKLFALLEGPPREDIPSWKLESQKEGFFVKAINLNKAKVATWAALSLLSGADTTKIALIGRADRSSSELHELLSVQTIPSKEFAAQLGVSFHKLFSNLMAIVKVVFKFNELRFASAQTQPQGMVNNFIMKEPKGDRLLVVRAREREKAQASAKPEGSGSEAESESDSDTDSGSESGSGSESD